MSLPPNKKRNLVQSSLSSFISVQTVAKRSRISGAGSSSAPPPPTAAVIPPQVIIADTNIAPTSSSASAAANLPSPAVGDVAIAPSPAVGEAANPPSPAVGEAANPPSPAVGEAANPPSPAAGDVENPPSPAAGEAANPPSPAVGEAAIPLPATNCAYHYDIGNYVGASQRAGMSDDMMLKLLTEPWSPPDNYPLPFSERTVKNKLKKFYLHAKHLIGYFTYSHVQKGVFCRACVLFASPTAGRGNMGFGQDLGQLVIKPLQEYSRLTGKNGKDGQLSVHLTKDYHKKASLFADNFIATMKNRSKDISVVCDKTIEVEIHENRKKLRPIVETITFCGRYNLPLRGHRESPGRLDVDCAKNEGVFRGLLSFRANAGDTALAAHLSSCAANASYISKTAQNELISCCGSVILNRLIHDVKAAQYFSILADDTSDASRIEQCCICVRFVDVQNGSYGLREEFLQFQDVEQTTGEALAATILSVVCKTGLDCSNCVGLGFDGAASMSGVFNGVQAVISRQFPTAVYSHCASHALSLSVVDSCKIPCIRDCMSVIRKVVKFLSGSPQRVALLKAEIADAKIEGNKKTRLTGVCETRWLERLDCVITFEALLSPVVSALEKLSESNNREVRNSAANYLRSLTHSEFIVSLPVLKQIFTLLRPITALLQAVGIDLLEAVDLVGDVLKTIRQKQENLESEFSKLFVAAEEMASKLKVTISMPRLAGRQTHRANNPATNAKDYYRVAYADVLGNMHSHISDRFTNHSRATCHFSAIIPRFLATRTFEDLRPALSVYSGLLESGDEDVISAEYDLWKTKWSDVADPAALAATAVDALNVCSAITFPNIHVMLRIFATVPVSTCSAQRAFSVLKRLKTYTRSTMCEERLNGLALLNIHAAMSVNIEDVIDKYGEADHRLRFR